MDPPECSGHSHDHDHTDDLGLSLRPQIDMPQVFCLNESTRGSGRAILKPHDERLTANPSLLSQFDEDDDPELLLHVPFGEGVTARSIAVRGGAGGGGGEPGTEPSAPRTVKLFADRTDLDFETARDLKPDMKLTLLPPGHLQDGTVDYPLRPAGRFQGITSITIYFADNYAMAADPDRDRVQTEINFVGFKGTSTKARRVAVDAVYESQGMRKDHRVPGDEYGAKHFL